MNSKLAEFACIALLWVGAAGVVASVYLSTQAEKIRCVCEFSAVIALALIVKLILTAHPDAPDNAPRPK